MISIERIKKYAAAYRTAIESAHQDGRFINDIPFHAFPLGCCGNTCNLLAEFLRREGIETILISGERGDWSHAWLVVKDERVKGPTTKVFYWPKELEADLKRYGVEYSENGQIRTEYEASDFEEGIIVDITGDQFQDCEEAIFVGKAGRFHQSFDFIYAQEMGVLQDERLYGLYQIVEEYL